MRVFNFCGILLFLLAFSGNISGQISPGDLAEPHAHLEGMSNCTKCHELGEKISDKKCLGCHNEIKSRIDQKRGYHSSADVSKKSCTSCHSDHLGRKYDILHLDKSKFDHQATGYSLEGKHKTKQCQDCHKSENLTDPVVKKKKMTYLGLKSDCLTCHDDYHQKTFSAGCADCHSYESFKPALKFDHSKSKFPLNGQHKLVECKKCHVAKQLNGKEFQDFKVNQFSSCVSCHKDIHENKFGQNCRDCHTEESFKVVKGISTFDHNKTNFKLEGKHVTLACKTCHKVSLTAPLLYNRCSDCHTDYHKGQFNKKGVVSDCSDCHTTKGFPGSLFTIERHNKGNFKIEGAHAATPCIACHKKENIWQFKGLDKGCISCHKNIHQDFIDEKFFQQGRCENCHNTISWGKVIFDHKTTTFELKGKHQERSCRDCHFKKADSEPVIQKFSGLKGKCEECHTDVHQTQFIVNGEQNCLSCHGFENWKDVLFDHNKTRFKLDGKHLGIECKKCHKEKRSTAVPYIQYKNTDTKCISCHFKS